MDLPVHDRAELNRHCARPEHHGLAELAMELERVSTSLARPVRWVLSFANANNAANPLVDRYGTTFNQAGPFTGSGSATFDGTAGYATSVVAQTQPPGVLSLGQFSGIGIWFKAPSGKSGPLFSFGAS